jgi:RNA recognition motif-containing protein
MCLLQAFVVFESPEDAQRACQKDRETFGDKFGDRYVRVYPTLESDVPDMQLAFQQQHMMQQVRSRRHGAVWRVAALCVGP